MQLPEIREALSKVDLDKFASRTGISIIILRRLRDGKENFIREETRLRIMRALS